MKDLSIIIPVYNSENTIIELVDRLIDVCRNSRSFEVILVNDGSSDNSYKICKELSSRNKFIKFISFHKNHGQANAILAGLSEAEGNTCVVMDDDLQHSPEEIPQLLNVLKQGFDFVFGISKKPQQDFLRVLASKLSFKTSDLMLDKPKDLYHSSFIAVKYDVVREIVKYDGPYPHISGLIFRVTRNGTNVIVNYLPRKSGKSQYILSKLIRLWLNSFTMFSIIPLRIASYSGVVISLVGFVVLLVLVIQKLLYGKFLTGWVSVIGSILLFSGIQLLALGLLGEYVGRIFMLLNKTPQYTIKEKYNCSCIEEESLMSNVSK